MRRLEYVTTLIAIKAMLESGNQDKAIELIDEVLAETRVKNLPEVRALMNISGNDMQGKSET